jgi:hypothetical protein
MDAVSVFVLTNKYENQFYVFVLSKKSKTNFSDQNSDLRQCWTLGGTQMKKKIRIAFEGFKLCFLWSGFWVFRFKQIQKMLPWLKLVFLLKQIQKSLPWLKNDFSLEKLVFGFCD